MSIEQLAAEVALEVLKARYPELIEDIYREAHRRLRAVKDLDLHSEEYLKEDRHDVNW